MTTTPRTLAQLHNQATSYEIIARHEDGRETRLGFTERRTKSNLYRNAADNVDILRNLIADDHGPISYAKATGWTFGPVRVCFSGRTEHDIAVLG